jgi:hypothetical protein
MSYLLLFFLAVRVYCVRFFLTNSTFVGKATPPDNSAGLTQNSLNNRVTVQNF